MIFDQIPNAGEYHLLAGWEEEKVVSPKKTPTERAPKKVVMEAEGVERNSSFSRFNDVFDKDYVAPSMKSRKTKGAFW